MVLLLLFIKFCPLKQDKPADLIMTIFPASLSWKRIIEKRDPASDTILRRDGVIRKLNLL